MASFGAKMPCFAPIASETSSAITYSTGSVIGKLVKADFTATNATGELWADDYKCESVKEFASGSIAMETDTIADATASKIFGCTVSSSVVTYSKDDVIPYGCVGYYKTLRVSGANQYKAYFYPKCQAEIGSDSAQTRGSSITFSTANITFTVDVPANGAWKKEQTFTTESACIDWLEEQCNITT